MRACAVPRIKPGLLDARQALSQPHYGLRSSIYSQHGEGEVKHRTTYYCEEEEARLEPWFERRPFRALPVANYDSKRAMPKE